MKNLTLLALLALSTFAIGQDLIYQQKTKLKKGIYKTYEEFRANSPSIPLNVEYKETSLGYGFLNANGLIYFGKLQAKRLQRKNLTQVYGFCNGKDIYINPRTPEGSEVRRQNAFHKIVYLGQYSYFETIKYSTVYNGISSSTTRSLSRNIISLRSGNVYELTKESLRKMLQSDLDLLEEFENEKHKKSVLVSYLIKYDKLHSTINQ